MSGTIAIVQARLGSSRLPGKALRQLRGKPLIWHVFHRLRNVPEIDRCVLATTILPQDDALAAWAEIETIDFIRGPEDDVLTRFEIAVDCFNPDWIFRVTGDAPLIDPDFCSLLLKVVQEGNADFALAEPSMPCPHQGVDVVSRPGFDRILARGRSDVVAREHVTGFIKEYPHLFRIASFRSPYSIAPAQARFTVDTPDDFAFIDALYEATGDDAGDLPFPEALRLANTDEGVRHLNAHVRQKSRGQLSGLVLIRCDGGGPVGFGHVRRCLAVATALRDREGLGVHFVMAAGEGAERAHALVREAGFALTLCGPGKPDAPAILALCEERPVRSLVLDITETRDRRELEQLRHAAGSLIVLDDPSTNRLAADLAVYPPVPQVADLQWPGFSGRVLAGWQWVLLAPDIAATATRQPPIALTGGQDLSAALAPRGPLKLLVSFGGSDPHSLTRTVAPLLRDWMAGHNETAQVVSTTVVIGPGVADAPALQGALHACGLETITAPASMADCLYTHDLALIAFGVTAYEAAIAGLAQVILATDENDAVSASAFEVAGVAKVLSVDPGRVEREALWQALDGYLLNGSARRAAGHNGRSLVDGGGAERLAAEIRHQMERGLVNKKRAQM
ncbi:MAG: NTP transferase domain-containing protein [Pseudomonadota bacterium]